MILDADGIAAFARAQFTGEALVAIVAIGLAESDGDTEALGVLASDGDGTRGYGLFQIEGGTDGPDGGNVAGGDWTDPAWQVAKAFEMSSSGTDFQPWCTAVYPMPGIATTGCGGYGSGNAVEFLADATAAVAAFTPAPPAPPAPTIEETPDMIVVEAEGTKTKGVGPGDLFVLGPTKMACASEAVANQYCTTLGQTPPWADGGDKYKWPCEILAGIPNA